MSTSWTFEGSIVTTTRVSPGRSRTRRSAPYFRAEPLRECVIVVRLDARTSTNLEIAIRVREVEEQEAACRPAPEIRRLRATRVQREAQLAVVVEEPDLRELRQPVAVDRAEGADLRVEQVAVGVGKRGHGPLGSWNTSMRSL
jgi:hypothetical protein